MKDVLTKPGMGLITEGVSPEQEIINKRQANSKTYDMGEQQFRVVQVLGAVHYEKEGQWEDIDLTVREEGGKLVMDNAAYSIEIFTDKIGYLYRSRQGAEIRVELLEVGRKSINNGRFSVRKEGHEVFWDNVEDGVNLRLVLRPLSAEIFKELQHEGAPRRFKWDIREEGDGAKFVAKVAGRDSGKGPLEINTLITSHDNGFYFEEEWTGRVSKVVNRRTRQKEWKESCEYPVVIDASTTENIQTNNDDGMEEVAGSWWSVTGTYLSWIATAFATVYYSHGGVRFQTLGIPQGATIDSADLKLNVASASNYPTLKIYADDVDDAANWANDNLPSGITKTTANQSWSPTGFGLKTISITNIVQEIVNRNGWVSGNDIRIAVLKPGPSSAGVFVYDYNKSQADAAQLVVNYTTGTIHVPRGGGLMGNLAVF